jgi:hypothetical protein
MTMESKVNVIGDIRVQLVSDDGVVREDFVQKNMVVSSGKALLASILASAAVAPTHIGLGSSNTASAAAQTALISEIGTRRVFNSAIAVDNVVSYTTTFPSGVGTAGVFREAGLFNSATLGTMMCRAAFNTVTKTTADNLVITWNVRIN